MDGQLHAKARGCILAGGHVQAPNLASARARGYLLAQHKGGGAIQGQGKGTTEATGGPCAVGKGKGISPSPEESQGADKGTNHPGKHAANTPQEAK